MHWLESLCHQVLFNLMNYPGSMVFGDESRGHGPQGLSLLFESESLFQTEQTGGLEAASPEGWKGRGSPGQDSPDGHKPPGGAGPRLMHDGL